MNIDTELQDYEAAGSLAEELPYWGWLDDERSCLTRAGELMSLARISPSVLDGQTPQQLDRVIERWQRMLSGLDARTRFYFYLLRRPIHFPELPLTGASKVVTLGQRKRREFLTKRVQDVSAYVAWAYDPGLSTVASGRTGGPWWMAYAKNWMARRRNAQRSVYLHSSIEAAAAGFRQTVDASRALVDDLTPLRLLKAHEASEVLSELTNRPGTPWDGATGSGMNWRLAVSELEAERRNLRLDGEPVVLYSLLSPPGSARSNLLSDLYRLDATLTVTLEWRPQRLDSARRKIRGAQRHYFSKRYSMSAHVQETEGSAAAMVDTAAAAESDRLGDALVELETDGVAYGDLALTIAIHGPLEHSESLDGDIRRIFASHDAKVIREGIRPTPRLVLEDARTTPEAAGPIRVCLSRCDRLHGPDLRSTCNSPVASRTGFWWNDRKTSDRLEWDNTIELGEKFFNEIIHHPVPLDMNILKALRRSSMGIDFYLWLTYRTFTLNRPLRLSWRQLYRQFGMDPAKAGDKRTVDYFRTDCLRELKKIKAAWPSLNYATVQGVLVLLPSKPVIVPTCLPAQEAPGRLQAASQIAPLFMNIRAGGASGDSERISTKPL